MIPKTFKIVNKDWMVRVVTTKQMQAHLDKHWNAECDDPSDLMFAKDMLGFCDPGSSRIFINKDKHRSVEDMEHTYYHELVHALLFADGHSDHDEMFVDRIGGYLHQVARTQK